MGSKVVGSNPTVPKRNLLSPKQGCTMRRYEKGFWGGLLDSSTKRETCIVPGAAPPNTLWRDHANNVYLVLANPWGHAGGCRRAPKETAKRLIAEAAKGATKFKR